MKRNISNSILVALLSVIFLFANFASAENIDVSARVGVVNRLPELLSVTPSFSPIVIQKDSIQAFSIQIKDFEGDNISYTITPDYGATSPISGGISNSTKLINGDVYIDFIYLSTTLDAQLGASKITLTLNDGINPVSVYDIDVYTF